MVKISEILKQAKALIADEKNWTQGEAARNAKGECVYSSDETAVCFCSLGALTKATGLNWLLNEEATNQLYYILEQEFNFNSIADFNDKHTHAEVMILWDKAIAAAEAQEEAK